MRNSRTPTNKYGAIKTEYNGVKYDSKAEAKYAEILDGLLAEGKIKKISRQVVYPLADRKGKNRLRYVADFVVEKLDGTLAVIDVKGILTPANNVKLAYVKYTYGIDVELVYTSGLEKFKVDFLILSAE